MSEKVYKNYILGEKLKLRQENEKLREQKENLQNIVCNKIISDYDIKTPLKEELNKARIKNLGLESEAYKLKSDWNELKEAIQKQIKSIEQYLINEDDKDSVYHLFVVKNTYKVVLDKMREIEGE